MAPPLFGNPAASEEARGFAPPPRGGFAFIAATMRQPCLEVCGCEERRYAPSYNQLRNVVFVAAASLPR